MSGIFCTVSTNRRWLLFSAESLRQMVCQYTGNCCSGRNCCFSSVGSIRIRLERNKACYVFECLLYFRRIRSREAAQKRRDNLSLLLKELCDLLPYDDSVKESFDKSTVLRLVVSYLRAKDHFGHNCELKPFLCDSPCASYPLVFAVPSQRALPPTTEASSGTCMHCFSFVWGSVCRFVWFLVVAAAGKSLREKGVAELFLPVSCVCGCYW